MVLPGSHGDYLRRYVDQELDELIPGLRAAAIEGAKGVGKTETARRRVDRVYFLDTSRGINVFSAAPEDIVNAESSMLIDEWQCYPDSWNLVRHAVDNRRKGLRLLTGSATPLHGVDTHSGAARILSILMRPLAFSERRSTQPSIFLTELINGSAELFGTCDYPLEDYAREICASGFPGLNELPERLQRAELDSYLQRIVDRDIPEMGQTLRKPHTLTAWLRAYAAATATTTTYSEILDAATPAEADKPSRSLANTYRDLLTKLWILDPLPAWTPSFSPFTQLKTSPKHYLVDPALSARLMGLSPAHLLDPNGGGKAFGQLFEALAVMTVRAAARSIDAKTYHFQKPAEKKRQAGKKDGSREVDIIVEDYQGRLLALEVKLKAHVTDDDVRHLNWLKEKAGERLVDRIVLTTGKDAFRRPDGVGIIPLAMLG